MIVYLLRHGEPIPRHNQSDRQATDNGLSEFGEIQARAAGKFLKKVGIEKVISSPIARARETAEIVSRISNLEIIFDERLREFFPDVDETDTKIGGQLKIEAKNNPEKVFKGGESLNQAIERLENLLNEIKLTDDTICLVTHRVLMEGYLSKNFKVNTSNTEWMLPASITAVDLSDNKLIVFNKVIKDFSLIWKSLINKIGYLTK